MNDQCVCVCCFVLFYVLLFVFTIFIIWIWICNGCELNLNLNWTKEFKCKQMDISIVIFPIATFKCGFAFLILKKWFHAAAAIDCFCAHNLCFVVLMSIASCISIYMWMALVLLVFLSYHLGVRWVPFLFFILFTLN